MKGIILAGGSGSRLYPATLAVSKQLLPVFDKPMIYYPLGVLMLAGIRDILIISTPARFAAIRSPAWRRQRLWDSAHLRRAGPARAASPTRSSVGREFVGNDSVALILGDNIFYGAGLIDLVREAASRRPTARPFSLIRSRIRNDTESSSSTDTGHATSIEEKPDRAEVELGGDRALFLRQPGARYRCRAGSVGARRARDHRRQPRLSRSGRASGRSARPRFCLARYRDARQLCTTQHRSFERSRNGRV